MNKFEDDGGSMVPRILPCNHTFCTGCAGKVSDCPRCRVPFLGQPGVNYAILDVIRENVQANPGGAETHGTPMPVDDPTFSSPLNVRVFKCNNDRKQFAVEVSPTSLPQRTPVCIIGNLDISSSMNSIAEVPESQEKSNIMMYQVAVHALKTVVAYMGPEDTFGLVTFGQSATKVIEPTRVTSQTRASINAKLDSITACGRTNLWGGLRSSHEMIRKWGQSNVVPTTVITLTDGQPNEQRPGRGEANALGNLVNSDQRCANVLFHMIGLGYGQSIDSTLLKELSEAGTSCFTYVSDGTLIGTAITSALANASCTAKPDACMKLCFSSAPGSVSVHGFANANRGGVQQNTAEIKIGRILRGQPKVFMVECSSPADLTNVEFVGSPSACVVTQDSPWSSPGYVAAWTSGELFGALNIGETQGRPYGLKKIGEIVQTLKTNGGALPIIKDLVDDLQGEVSMAFNREDYWSKWGKHYVCSMVRVLALQECGNFKDKGMQHFCPDGSVVCDLRDHADSIFTDKVPAPKVVQSMMSSSFSYKGGNYGGSYTAAPPSAVSMGNFMDRGGVCWGENTKITMLGGSEKPVKELKKHDQVLCMDFTPASVVCVVETTVPEEDPSLVELVEIPTYRGGALFVTPWHPMLVENNKWAFPKNMAGTAHTNAQDAKIRSVYSVVLDTGHTVVLNGDGVSTTLGHGVVDGDPVRAHEFWGRDVVEHLKKLNGWDGGHIVMPWGSVSRNEQGVVNGFIV
jgi:hypothetical protein